MGATHDIPRITLAARMAAIGMPAATTSLLISSFTVKQPTFEEDCFT
jgi:hypothetical protein